MPASAKSVPQRRRSITPIVITSLVVLFVLLLLGWFRLGFSIEGEEFSPAYFAKRRFTFRGWKGFEQISARYTYDPMNPICGQEILKHLTQSVTAHPNGDRWDVIGTFSSNLTSASRFYEAQLLVELLERTVGTQSKFWHEWSAGNPKSAAVLWPFIQQLAFHQAYFAIPPLLNDLRSTVFTTSASDDELKDVLEDFLIERSISITQIQFESLIQENQRNEAARLLDWCYQLTSSDLILELAEANRLELSGEP